MTKAWTRRARKLLPQLLRHVAVGLLQWGTVQVVVAVGIVGLLLAVGAAVLDAVSVKISIGVWQIVLLLAVGVTLWFAMVRFALPRIRSDPTDLVIDIDEPTLDMGGVGPSATAVRVNVKRNGKPARNVKVELLSEDGTLTAENSSLLLPLQVFGYTDRTGTMLAAFSATEGSSLGVTTITAIVHCRSAPNLIQFQDVTIVGPPDDWRMTLSRHSVFAGEAVEIGVEAKDEIDQDVWDGTRVRFEASNGGKVDPPIATFLRGEAAAILLTGNIGICTVVATLESTGELIYQNVEVQARPQRS